MVTLLFPSQTLYLGMEVWLQWNLSLLLLLFHFLLKISRRRYVLLFFFFCIFFFKLNSFFFVLFLMLCPCYVCVHAYSIVSKFFFIEMMNYK